MNQLNQKTQDYRTKTLEALSQRRIDRLTAACVREQQTQRQQQLLLPPPPPGGKALAAGDGAAVAVAVASGAGQGSSLNGRSPVVASVLQQLTRRRNNHSSGASSYGASWWAQVRAIAWRNVTVASRNIVGRFVATFLPTFFAVILGLIWSNRGVCGYV